MDQNAHGPLYDCIQQAKLRSNQKNKQRNGDLSGTSLLVQTYFNIEIRYTKNGRSC